MVFNSLFNINSWSHIVAFITTFKNVYKWRHNLICSSTLYVRSLHSTPSSIWKWCYKNNPLVVEDHERRIFSALRQAQGIRFVLVGWKPWMRTHFERNLYFVSESNGGAVGSSTNYSQNGTNGTPKKGTHKNYHKWRFISSKCSPLPITRATSLQTL